MRTQKVIEQFGYKPNEAKVYIAALSLGQCTISDIAQKVKLPRTSVKVIIDKLHADGLMNFYIKKRYKYWTAENPESFLVHLKEKQMSLEAALPQLQAIKHHGDDEPIIKVFNGISELKLIDDDMLDTKNHISAIIPWDKWVELWGKEDVSDFVEKRVRHFLKLKLLTTKTKESLRLKESDSRELRDTCFLPAHVDINNAIFVYGDKVVIISLNKKEPTGILINDPHTSHTMKVLFQELWDSNFK